MGFRSARMAALTVVLAIGVAGCQQIVTEGAMKALEDRSTEDQVADGKIYLGIQKGLADIDKGLLLDVSADVWEGRVLLTGTLDDAAMRRKVTAMVGTDKRVTRIYDEVLIVPTDEKNARRKEAEKKDKDEKSGVGQAVSDFWIETKIKGQLVASGGVTSVNYRWRSVKNTVYIIGRAGTAKERDKVLKTIRDLDGVKKVKHFIEIKPVEG